MSLAGVKADGLGFVSLDRAGVAGLRVAAPLVTRSDGAPVSEANPVMSVNAAGNVVISIDAAWLRAQPASAFPVALDPSLYWAGTDDERSYKSDGYSCSGCGIQFGNSRDNNTNKYWRSMVHFPYATVFNAQIVDAWLDVSYRSGSADTSLPITAWAASAFSYGGVIQSGYQVGSGSLAAGLSGGGLRSYVEQYVNNQSSTMWIGFTGSEGSSYTYQKIWATLYITFNRWPSAPVRVSPAPVDGSSAHTLTYTLAASSTDADGDTLKYWFRASLNPDPAVGPFVDTGWLSASSVVVTLPGVAWNKKIYWRAHVWDGYATSSSSVWSFTPTNVAPTVSGLVPATDAVVSTSTPVLSATGSDANNDTLQYNFTISGGADTPVGRASSGWLSSASWRVPPGVLEDGQQYAWTVTVRDGGTDADPWLTGVGVANVRVNLRLGGSGPAPVDGFAGVSVGLANGNVQVGGSGHGVNSLGGALSVGLSYNSQAALKFGLRGAYYQEKDRNWQFGPVPADLVRVDPSIDFRWNQSGAPDAPPGLAKDQFLVRWTGYLTVPVGLAAGTYTLGVSGDDGVRIGLAAAGQEVDMGSPVYVDWTAHGAPAVPVYGSGYQLTPGVPVRIQIEYYNQGGPGSIALYVKDPSSSAQRLPSTWLTPGLSVLPAGWTLALPGGGGGYSKASASASGSVVLTDGDGAAHAYLSTGSGGFRPPPGEDGVLSGDAKNGWTLADSDGSVYVFDGAGLPLSARSALDSVHPAAAVYTYDTTVTPPRVSVITDPVSTRTVGLTYGPDATNCPAVTYQSVTWDAAPANMLCKVTYWDGTATVLHYSGGQLAAIEEPGAAYTQFGYGQGLLTQIRDTLANDAIAHGVLSSGWTSATTSTTIEYGWVAPATGANQTNIRPAYVTTSPATPGAIPMVVSVTAPAPDGVTASSAPRHSYDYTAGVTTTKVNVAYPNGAGSQVKTAVTVTYDSTGRVLTSTSATGQVSSQAWDANSRDLPVWMTDPAGRRTSTVYDWAARATDTFGPAPAGCFDATTGVPLTSPPGGITCSNIPHTHTGYDTNTTGTRINKLAVDQYSGTTLSGAPTARATATLDPTTWPSTGTGRSTRATGELALAAGTHTFSATLANTSDDGIRVYVGDQVVLDRWWTPRQAVIADAPYGYWRLGSTTADPNATITDALTNTATVFTGAARTSAESLPTAVFANASLTAPEGILPALTGTGKAPSLEIWFKTSEVPPGSWRHRL